jgi:DNA repair protein RecN (Recombination protein N)
VIEELRIRGIGVIDEARVELAPGLTVITGETGAGKTMVLSGLELLRGGRADAGVLRDGAAGAEVDAVVSVDGSSVLVADFEELGLSPPEDGAVITRRTIAAGGRSRAYLDARPVPVSTLAQVWSHIVAVHGQMDQAKLREAAWQRAMVDRFGGAKLAAALEGYAQTWRNWQQARGELERLRAGAQEAERHAALLRLGIAEIDDVAPEAGEDVSLDGEAAVLAHAGALRDGAVAARAKLSGSGDDIDAAAAITRLAGAREDLAAIADIDERVRELSARVESVLTECVDIDGELSDYARQLDADPARQAWVEERRSRLSALRKSYGATIEDVLRWRADAAEQIAAADTGTERIEQLTVAVDELAQAASEQAEELSSLRRDAAGLLLDAVHQELTHLAMPEARLDVSIASTSEPESLTAHGGDSVAITLMPHAGASARPIGKGASGGELSRLALAFEVALADSAPVGTMVFDEVDAGVGGAVAVEVGRRLARLSRHVQVVVVTHLPQVAAFADRHLVVTKGGDGSVTSADVSAVDGPDRVAELVRMLSGLEGSTTGAAHAEELLDAFGAGIGGRDLLGRIGPPAQHILDGRAVGLA